MGNKSLERIFHVAAAVLVLAAGYSLWEGDHERVFVFAVLGSLSFFIGFRFQVKQRLAERDEQLGSRGPSAPEGEIEIDSPPNAEKSPAETKDR